jgi:hypothetical protein
MFDQESGNVVLRTPASKDLSRELIGRETLSSVLWLFLVITLLLHTSNNATLCHHIINYNLRREEVNQVKSHESYHVNGTPATSLAKNYVSEITS